jgi:imidazolonepropionase-like amidohydrolase
MAELVRLKVDVLVASGPEQSLRAAKGATVTIPIVVMWDALWRNGKLATMTAGTPFGLIDRGAIGVQDGRIAWVGHESALPGQPTALARAVHDLGGRLLTPGLVDCHNHCVYYGNALNDFELLTQGGTRADMIAAGGGVQGLVRQTRAASDEQIYAARPCPRPSGTRRRDSGPRGSPARAVAARTRHSSGQSGSVRRTRGQRGTSSAPAARWPRATRQARQGRGRAQLLEGA